MEHIHELSSKTLLPGLHLYVFQIRVNSVNPTVVLTPLGKMGFGTPEKQAQRKNRIPLGRLAGTCQFRIALLIHLLALLNMVIHKSLLMRQNLFQASTNHKGTDQHAHQCSLISTFVVS